VLRLTVLDAIQGLRKKPASNNARPCDRDGRFFRQLGIATAQCLASPLTGMLGAGTVLLMSVDATTRKLSGKEEARRTRPPRVFEPASPRLLPLQDRMVVSTICRLMYRIGSVC